MGIEDLDDRLSIRDSCHACYRNRVVDDSSLGGLMDLNTQLFIILAAIAYPLIAVTALEHLWKGLRWLIGR